MIPHFPNLSVFKQWAEEHVHQAHHMHHVSIAQYTYTVTHVNPVRRTATYDPEAGPACDFYTYCRALFEQNALPMETQCPPNVASKITEYLNALLKKHAHELPTDFIETTTPSELGANGGIVRGSHHGPARAQPQVHFAGDRTVLTYDNSATHRAEELRESVDQQERALTELEAAHAHHAHHQHHEHHKHHHHGHHHHTERLEEARQKLQQTQTDLAQAEQELWEAFSKGVTAQEPDPQPENTSPRQLRPPCLFAPPSIDARVEQAQRANEHLHTNVTEKLLHTPSGPCLAIPAYRPNYFVFRPEATTVPITVYDPITHATRQSKGLYDANYVRCPKTAATIAARRPFKEQENQCLFWQMVLQQRTNVLVDGQHSDSHLVDYYPNVVDTCHDYGQLTVTCTAVAENTVTLNIADQQTKESHSLTVLKHQRPSEITRNTAGELVALSNQLLSLNPESITVACGDGIEATGLIWASILIAKQVNSDHMNWHNKEKQINRIVRGLKTQRHPYIINTNQERFTLSQVADDLLSARDQAVEDAWSD